MSELEESLAALDSTIREQRIGFSHGDDVLQHKDGKFYLGTVVEVDLARERCLVNFMDNTSSWSSFKELTKLAMPDLDVMCVLCKKSQPKTDNDIVVCDKCGRGYHQMCHQPQIPKQEADADHHWMCKKCTDSQPLTREPCEPKTSMVKASIRKVCSGRNQPQPPPDDMTKLPYNFDMLSWDAHHRVNAEQIYCYCGLNGKWYAQMLQCARCKQWFHEKCIRCLTHPLYSGDRFYVFVCSMCNHGKEFVWRLEMNWVDLVHLMLYNLTVYNAKKYYDLDTAIIPYANDNWYTLQLPPRIKDVNVEVRKESILSILTNNRTRFKCGKEIKKSATIWGLRVKLPPPCSVVNLPATGEIDDSVLRRCWLGVKIKKLQYLPPQIGVIIMPPKIDIWSKEKEHRLIFEVEKRPILWDVSLEIYKRTDLKYNQWHEIAEILGPSFSADMVLHRFTSMKQTFMTNHRKERESKEKCSGKRSPEEIYKPKWSLYEKLKFLKKSCAQADSQSNLQNTNLDKNVHSSQSTALENLEYLENDFIDIQQWQAIPSDDQKNETDNDSSCTSKNSKASSSLSRHKSHLNSSPGPSTISPGTTHSSILKPYNKQDIYVKRGAAKRQRISLIEETVRAIKSLTDQPVAKNDSAEYLGNFVAARLREMNSISRKNCEQDIMNILINY